MSKITKIRVIATVYFTVVLVYSGVYRHFSPRSDAYLTLGMVLLSIIGLSWKRVYSHPAFVSGMICLSVGVNFIGSWMANGLEYRHTVIHGLLFAIIALITLAQIRMPSDV